MIMNKVELLSPAGDYNCFLAAINAGADAVYLSGDKFGARAYAKNFSTEEVLSAIDYAHVFDRKVFLTVNTLLKDDEISQLYEYLEPFYSQGLDGVIVQDMGVVSCIRTWFPDMPVHASTQLTITGLEGMRLLEKEGIKRTVLAREVSLDEIKHIHNNSDMEIECFIHGALCYSYSGKCLFSSLVGGRSGNRGRCAGSCRQPYNGKYLLSTKDICCLEIIPDLIEAGICSFKIEGRMKSPEYVAGVTSVYRKYIDIYYDNLSKMSSDKIKDKYFKGPLFKKDYDLLTKLYTRGDNSTGYYYKHNGREMITLEDASYKSDKGNVKSAISDKFLDSNLKMKINGFISIIPDTDMVMVVSDARTQQFSVSFEGTKVLKASNRPLDRETVLKQLNKTNDTEFEFADIDIVMSDDAFVRISDLNEIRRNALTAFKNALLDKYRRTQATKYDLLNKVNCSDSYTESDAEKIELVCDVTSIEQFNSVVSEKRVNRIDVPYSVLCNFEDEVFSKAENDSKAVFIKFPSVIRYNYLEENREKIIEVLKKADGIVADSHEVIEFIKAVNTDNKPIMGDIHIYALNNAAYVKYRNIGFSRLTVPVELNKKELYKRDIQGEELIAYGYLPMMISAQCVNRTVNGCDRTGKILALTDRTGAEFTAMNNCADCSNTILNSVPISLHKEFDFIKRISPAAVKLVFTKEKRDEILGIVSLYSDMLDKESNNNNQDIIKDNTYTKGHLNRGVL